MRNRFRQPPRSRARRLVDWLAAVAFIAIVIVAAARFERFAMQETIGAATISDGDSLVIGGERIRLRGIDAPELDQTCTANGADYACGRSARDALRVLAAGSATCQGWERDKYRRLLAVCRAGGRDLNRAQVEAGWAIAYGDYADAERTAREAKAGLWAGTFERPGDWRVKTGDAAEAEHGLIGAILNLLRELFRTG
ncbi:MAG: thermonuclease family protein [Rhizobiaceae bacterium]